MLGPKRPAIADTAEEDRNRADSMALFDQALNQRLRFARGLTPYNVVTRPNYPGEIEIT